MNIFASFPDPVRSAEWLDDQRQIKMPLECAQMLSTCCYLYSVWTPQLLKPTHETHPCVVWTCTARENFEWLWEHMLALDSARQRRVTAKAPQTHKSVAKLIEARAWRVKSKLPPGFTPHVNCARHGELGIDYTNVQDTHKAYRMYLNHRWRIQDKPAVCTLRAPR